MLDEPFDTKDLVAFLGAVVNGFEGLVCRPFLRSGAHDVTPSATVGSASFDVAPSSSSAK